ncbi:MAG TPA: pitrilysin family protein [Pyrinomonadaceae bacterium]|jgi:predicted Zn-dependent peptidase|nr:pitrilysin family protein [Pyrinomonadaceae bacterium]
MKAKRTSVSCFLLIVSVFVAGTAPSFAQDAATVEKQITEFDVNGLKVIVKRRLSSPTVAAELFFRGGSSNLTPQTAGIETFALNVADEGSKLFPRAVLRKETSRMGTVIGSSSSRDFSVLSLVCTKQNLEPSWKMFADVAINPAFAADDVERVRANILTGLRSKTDSPDASLQELVERTIYAGHPYANDPDGTIENVTRFKAADLAAYHKSLMQTSRLLLVIVGDVDPSVIKERVTAAFGSLPRGDYKAKPLPSLDLSKASLDVQNKSVQTDYVEGSFSAPSIGDPDYYAMRTAVSILQTSVYQEVRVKRNLSYAPDAALGTSAANTAYVYVTSNKPNEAASVMIDAIRDLQNGQVTDEVIKAYANFFLTTYYLGQEANIAQATELARYELVGGGWRRSLQFLDGVRNVKPDEVQAVAKKYMNNIRWTVVGNPADINRSIFVQN